MANFYCFLDESFDENVFVLGGIFIIDEEGLSSTLSKWQEFKKSIGLRESDPIKWSLGGKGDEKNIKSKIKRHFSAEKDWLSTFRIKALNIISSCNPILLASLNEDVRVKWYKKILSNNQISPVEFYLWAFKFLLQRIWRLVKDKDNVKNVFVIIDKPPEAKKFRGSEIRICESYQDAYKKGFPDLSIKPLKDYGFFESVLIAKNNFCSFIQISDFCVGTIRERARDLLKNNPNSPSKDFLKSILKLFYKTGEKDLIGKGLIVFPPGDQTLHNRISNDIDSIFNEIDEDEFQF